MGCNVLPIRRRGQRWIKIFKGIVKERGDNIKLSSLDVEGKKVYERGGYLEESPLKGGGCPGDKKKSVKKALKSEIDNTGRGWKRWEQRIFGFRGH